jgi:hypothetical protein
MTQKHEARALTVPVNHGDHFVSARSPWVIIVEYGDFECPSQFLGAEEIHD